MLPTKSQLRDWIIKGKYKEVFAGLHAIAENNGDKQLSDSNIQLEGRYNRLKKQEMLGTESSSSLNIERNKITQALLGVIAELEEDKPDGQAAAPRVRSKAPPPPVFGDSSEKPKKTGNPTAPPPPPGIANSKIPLYVGGASLLLLLGIILFVPCPTSPQYIIFRIVLALGAAGVASVLPGFFKFGNKIVSAGGALAVFALVFFIDPVKSVATDECGNGPFTQTVFLRTESGESPKAVQGELVLFLDNNQNDRPIAERGEVIFNGIPGRFKSEPVPVHFELEAEGYVLTHPDSSYVLDGSTLRIPIQRDASLGLLRGYVLDASTQAPIDSARLSSDGETFYTRQDGFFEYQMKRIQESYPVRIAKEGYNTRTEAIYPGSAAEVRLEKAE